jgi:Flp pilus assembly protein TadG
MDDHQTLDARTRERGTALIEFALILPLLLLLTVAAVDLGRAFYVKNMVEQSAREGARLRVVTSSADSSLVRSRVQTVLQPAGVSLTGLSIAGPDASRAVTVTVTVQFNWLNPGIFNLFGAGFTNPMTLNGKAVMRNEGAS